MHLARSGYDGQSNEIRDLVRVEYIVNYTYNANTSTDTLSNDHQFQAIPNLLPNASMVVDPLPCEYNGTIDISWDSATDPNNDNLNYNVYILDESDGTVALTVALGISTTSVTDVDISSLANGFYNIKIEACDASGCESFLWDGLFGNTGDHLYLGGTGSILRTKGNGNWLNAAIWEENTGTCDSWVDVAGAPDDTYSGWTVVSPADSVVVESGTAIPQTGMVEGVVNALGHVTGNVLMLKTGAIVYCQGDWNVGNVISGSASIIMNGDNAQTFKANNNTLGDIKFKGVGVKTFETGSYQVDIKGDMVVLSDAEVNQAGGAINVSGELTLESSATGNATFIPGGGTFSVSNDSVDVEQVVSFSDKVYSISVPASGVTTPASAGITNGIYSWDNAQGSWVATASDDVLLRGVGYMCKSSNDLKYSGNISQDNVDVSVTRSGNGLGWNFLGNPFTSAINWESIGFDSNVIADKFWLWNQESQVYGAYNGLVNMGVNLDADNPSIIPSGHSFWIKVKEGYSSANFPFAQSDRVSNSHSYLKSIGGTEYESVRLIGCSGDYSDEIAIVDVYEAVPGVDGYDVEKKLSGKAGTFEIFTQTGVDKLSIDSQPISGNTLIALGYSTEQAGQYSISLSSQITGLDVLLEDKLMNETFNLSGGSAYDFEVPQAGLDSERFLVSFIIKVPADIKNGVADESINCYTEQGKIFANTADIAGDVNFRVYDLSGKLRKAGRLSETGRNLIGEFTPETYVIKFHLLHENLIIVKKVTAF